MDALGVGLPNHMTSQTLVLEVGLLAGPNPPG